VGVLFIVLLTMGVDIGWTVMMIWLPFAAARAGKWRIVRVLAPHRKRLAIISFSKAVSLPMYVIILRLFSGIAPASPY
jgi:hypothetical protein